MKRALILQRPVVAITGSAGKTTTKEMIASILQQRWKIFKSKGNANMPRHTAKYAKQINSSHRAVVLEYAMSRFGHIRRHCRLIKPNIGIVTSIGSAHMGNVDGVRGVARAKSELIKYMNQRGTLFLNKDDANAKLLQIQGFKGKIVRIGVKNNADYRGYNLHYTNNGVSFQIKLQGKIHRFDMPVYGNHNVNNALLAIAVADHLGLTPGEMKKGLHAFKKSKRRLNLYKLGRGIHILDDTYSANPHAVKAAIDVLTTIGKKSNIAVLGTMLEMGKYSVKNHKYVGRYLAKKNITHLYTYGNDAKYIGAGAIEAGYPRSKVRHFTVKSKLNRHLLNQIKSGNTILVKGSNKMKMNETVQFLVKRLQKAQKRA